MVLKFYQKTFKFYSTWIRPVGHETGIKIYNCITKQKEDFILRDKNLITWYTCGPTVYDSAHLGHASCYVKLDNIQRILTDYFKFNLVTVMNVTDIDDKIIQKSNRKKISCEELAKTYENEFWSDMLKLDVKKPDIILRVSENMSQITKFIETLVDKGFAYVAKDGSVYFNVNKFSNYGKLWNVNTEEMSLEGSENKLSPMDFALWKASKPFEPVWDSKWSPGRPGWHIECSTLATSALGSQIDIHAGGVDLKFPHHENEEAQSCAYHDTSQWVNYWLHTGFLHQKNDVKMSKSLNNTISIAKLLESTPSEVFRLACLMSHYRSSMEYSEEFMLTAKNTLKNYKNFLHTCKGVVEGFVKVSVDDNVLNDLLSSSSVKLKDALCDDFNTPEVINILNHIVTTTNHVISSSSCSENQNYNVYRIITLSKFVQNTLELFSIKFSKSTDVSTDNSTEIMDTLNEFRQDIRRLGIELKNSDILNCCDRVRTDLRSRGIVINDHGKQSTWSR